MLREAYEGGLGLRLVQLEEESRHEARGCLYKPHGAKNDFAPTFLGGAEAFFVRAAYEGSLGWALNTWKRKESE